NQIVAFESQRIAEKLERDAVIAAERQSGEQVATIRADLERARGDDIGRHGDDRGRGRNRTAGGFYRHAAPAVDRSRRRRELDRPPLGQGGKQRAEAWLAERRAAALRCFGKIG